MLNISELRKMKIRINIDGVLVDIARFTVDYGTKFRYDNYIDTKIKYDEYIENYRVS